MALTGDQARKLRDAIVSSFTLAELDDLTRLELDERLENVTASGPLPTVVLNLLEWVDERGRISDLIRAVQRARSGNPEIQSITSSLLATVEPSSPHPPRRRPPVTGDRNRNAMIEKVRTIWIRGFLQKSLFQETRIILGLSERPDAVSRPLDLLIRRPDEGARPLPPGIRVVDVFDSTDHSLLILGAPGGGKTTLLLELTRDLLDRAAQDPAHPIPVIFPLSTWTESRKTLVEWLVDELNLRYDVPRKIAEEWVASNEILPLLDGLDEVKSEYRADCVEAVNAFRQTHGFLPVAIASRTADYEALAEPLRLQGAILVRPLTREQVNAYLAGLGPGGKSIRAAIDENPSLWELLDNPLLLNVVTVAYASEGEAPPRLDGPTAELRDRLFGSYVNQMLRRRAADRRYTPEQVGRWLRWLARQMEDHGQTIFYLERLRPDWLPRRQRRMIWIWNALAVGLSGGLVLALIDGLYGGLTAGPANGLFVALYDVLVGGMILGVIFGLASRKSHSITCVDRVGWSWSGFRRVATDLRAGGLIGGVAGGLFVASFSLLEGNRAGGLVGEVIFGGLCIALLGAVVGAVVGMLRSGLAVGEIETRSVPNEGIRRSARNALRVAGVVLLVGGLSGALVGGLLGEPFVGLVGGLDFGLIIGLLVAWQAGGEACLKHLLLRLWLIRYGSTPWNYVRFLDYAADRILLRRVGGGYAFVHRMLLDYFAARYVGRSASG